MVIHIGAHRGNGEKEILDARPVALSAVYTEPLLCMGLLEHRAGTNDLPSVSTGISWLTNLIEAASGWRKIGAFGEGSLAGDLAGTVEVEKNMSMADAVVAAAEKGVAQTGD